MSKDTYTTGAFITGALFFIGIWIATFTQWGFLIGLAIGWLPALIGASIAGLIWPLFAILIGLAILAGLGWLVWLFPWLLIVMIVAGVGAWKSVGGKKA